MINANVNFYGVNDECEFYHEIDFKNDKIGAKISHDYNCLSFDNVIYIDAPSIFDFNNLLKFNSKSSPNHLKLLYNQINNFQDKSDVYDSEYNEKIIRFHEKFKKILNGLIYYDSDKEDFIYKKRNQKYSMKNTASGVKQLGVLQVLLENRILKEDSFLIIDEVEVNLHPKWQLKLAEILVLLARDLDIYVYINSHSPHFIETLEVYSGKYGPVNDSKFYLS